MVRLIGSLLLISAFMGGCASASYTKITHVYKVDGKEYTVESVYPSDLGMIQPGEALKSFIESLYPSETTQTTTDSQTPQTTTVHSNHTLTTTPTRATNPVGNQLNNQAK